jgi:hypothetical protein
MLGGTAALPALKVRKTRFFHTAPLFRRSASFFV